MNTSDMVYSLWLPFVDHTTDRDAYNVWKSKQFLYRTSLYWCVVVLKIYLIYTHGDRVCALRLCLCLYLWNWRKRRKEMKFFESYENVRKIITRCFRLYTIRMVYNRAMHSLRFDWERGFLKFWYSFLVYIFHSVTLTNFPFSQKNIQRFSNCNHMFYALKIICGALECVIQCIQCTKCVAVWRRLYPW